jgi:hypothetical protein
MQRPACRGVRLRPEDGAHRPQRAHLDRSHGTAARRLVSREQQGPAASLRESPDLARAVGAEIGAVAVQAQQRLDLEEQGGATRADAWHVLKEHEPRHGGQPGREDEREAVTSPPR